MKKLIMILIIALAFFTGFLSCYALNSFYIDTESPFLINLVSKKPQPGNWLSEQDIKVFPDKVIIYVRNAILGRYADTGSMLPVLGKYTTGIKIKPTFPEQINVGDIISYNKGNMLIVHRVVGKGKDKKGFYFVTKGENNTETDGKVYFQDVEYVTIALIY